MPVSTPAANHLPARTFSPDEAVSGTHSINPSRRSLALWMWSVLLIADVLLVARGVSGQMSVALPPSLAFGSMMLIALASLAAWLAYRSGSPQQDLSQPSAWGPIAVSIAASLLWCLTIAFHASPLTMGLLVGVVLVQGLMMGAMAAENLDAERRAPNNRIIPEFSFPDDEHRSATRPLLETLTVADEPLAGEDASDEADADLTQWMSRRETGDGEVIEGWMRIEFRAGQREATIHISFCPPLASLPKLETEDLDGADLEIRVGSVFPFGARLTVRQTGPTAQPHSARIGFAAAVNANQRAA